MADNTFHLKIKVDADTSAAKASLAEVSKAASGAAGTSVSISQPATQSKAAASVYREIPDPQFGRARPASAVERILSVPRSQDAVSPISLNPNSRAAQMAAAEQAKSAEAVAQAARRAAMEQEKAARQAEREQTQAAKAAAAEQSKAAREAQKAAEKEAEAKRKAADMAAKAAADATKAAEKEAEAKRKASAMSIKSGGDTLNQALGAIMPGGGSGLASKIAGLAGGVVKAGTVLASGIAGAFGPVGAVVGSVLGIFGTLAGGLLNGLGRIGDLLLSIPGMIFGFLKNLAFGVGAAAVAFAGSIYAAHKLMGAAAEDEKYQLQLSRLGAAGKLDSYKQVAAEGPQALTEVVRTGIQLESFGLDSNEWMKPIQDAAAMFGKPMDELGGAIGKLKGGQAGEALEALRNVGVLRSDLERKSIKFDGVGTLQSGIAETLAAVKDVLNQKSGGMAATMSLGYEGAVSNLGDAVHSALSSAFEKAIPYASYAIRSITDGISQIGQTFAQIDWRPAGEALNSVVESAKGFILGIDWAGWGNTLVGVFSKAANVVNSLFSAEGREKIVSGLSALWDNVRPQLQTILNATLAALGQALALLPGLIYEGMTATSKPVVDMAFGDGFVNKTSSILGTIGGGLVGGKAGAVAGLGLARGVQGYFEDAGTNGKGYLSTYASTRRRWAEDHPNEIFPEDKPERQAKLAAASRPQSVADSLKEILSRLANAVSAPMKNIADSAKSSASGPATAKPASSIDYAGKYGVDTTAASSSVSAAVEAGKAAAGIVVDKTNPGKSAEALKAGRAVFDTEKGAAESAIAELENSLMLMQSSAGAELARNIRDMRSKGAGDGEIAAYRASQQAAEQASYAPLIKQILNYRGGLDKSGGLIESKNDEIAKAQKEQNSYLAALNKMTAQMLNEIKALNDYNMTEIADSVFA